MCGRAIVRTESLHGTFRRLMKVGGFFVLLVRNLSSTYPMSTRRTYSSRSHTIRSLHRFDNGFIPTANRTHDSITVTRNSPLISGVQRKRPGEYWIKGGSFIGGGASRDATAEEAAEYMSQSPHWSVLMRLTKELGWEDVHRYLGMEQYGFVPMRLPIPES
jgi:hypothetical protein